MTVANPGPASFSTSMLTTGGFGASAGQLIMANFVGALASSAVSSGQLIVVQVDVPWPRTFTGVAYMTGTVAGTASGTQTPALYDASGNRVATGPNVTTGQVGTSQRQALPFTSAYSAAAGTYFYGFTQANVTSATWTQAAAVLSPIFNNGTFGIVSPTITPPTAISVTACPLMWLY